MSDTMLSSSHVRRVVFKPAVWLQAEEDSKETLLFKLKYLKNL